MKKAVMLMFIITLSGCDKGIDLPKVFDCEGSVITINGTKASYGNIHTTLTAMHHHPELYDSYTFEYENDKIPEYSMMLFTRTGGGYKNLWKHRWSIAMSRTVNMSVVMSKAGSCTVVE